MWLETCKEKKGSFDFSHLCTYLSHHLLIMKRIKCKVYDLDNTDKKKHILKVSTDGRLEMMHKDDVCLCLGLCVSVSVSVCVCVCVVRRLTCIRWGDVSRVDEMKTSHDLSLLLFINYHDYYDPPLDKTSPSSHVLPITLSSHFFSISLILLDK